MLYSIPILFAALGHLQQDTSNVRIALIVIGALLVLFLIAALAGSGGSGGGGGGSSSSLSSYTSSFDNTRSSARSRMGSASDEHLRNVRDTLRK